MEIEKNFQEEPIPLVVYNSETKVFEVNEEARAFLKQLDGPLGIISVAGMYRTGKSFLLNRMLLNRSGGFGVGPTVNPCTKGVWMWGQPIEGYTPEGEKINIIVLDTEGIGALDEDSNHDVRIFSLAILLSSYFIYNSMGSIDESALSNLSLVINLTKHIHLKSSGLSEDIDPEEYAHYFPAFMWVVRDFSLQLVDQENEPITPKDYLEKALQPQKGFSDQIEQKNRIRRMLKSFFKERDCCTMIRPLTNETNLQSLDKVPLEEMRPEFKEQVMQLRRKVINRIQPKMMHQKKLNGEMLFNLTLSYVDAINKGAVPNIESAWSYICKNECLKAQYEAQQKFEKAFQDDFEERAPIFEDELREIYKDARKTAIEDFSKVAVGEVQKAFVIELKDRMQQKFKQLKQENDRLSQEQCLMFLQQNYTSIEKKLKNQEYGNIYEFVEELNIFSNYFFENGPPGPKRDVVLYEFLYKSVAEAAEFFFRAVANELILQQQIKEEQVTKLQADLKEVKDEQKKKFEAYDTKIRTLETEKATLSASEQAFKEQISQLVKEKEQLEVEMSEKVGTQKRESDRIVEEYKYKMQQSDENLKELQRQKISIESEFEKQKVLLDQRIEFYEKSIEDLKFRLKDVETENKKMKSEYANQSKENAKQYDNQIKDLNRRADDLNEKAFEWESKYQDLEQKYEQELLSWQDLEAHLKKENSKLKETNNDLFKQIDTLKKRYNDDFEKFKQNSEEDNNNRSEQIKDLEYQVKTLQEQYDIAVKKWEKDIAIEKQGKEFLDLQVKELKSKNEEDRRNHESIMKNLQNSQRESVIGKEESNKRLQEIKDKYADELADMEKKNEAARQKLQTQIDQLTERNQELVMSLKIQVGDFEKEVENLREQLSSSEEQRFKAVEQMKLLESQKGKYMEEYDTWNKQRIAELEKDLEDKTAEFEDRINEVQTKSEEQLSQLKSYYETEKDRAERRLVEDKDRAQKRYNNMVEDYEQKLREEQNTREEEVQNLEQEISQTEMKLNQYIQQLEHELGMKDQQLKYAEQQLAELKQNLANLQESSNGQLEHQESKFNDERKDLLTRIERLSSDLVQKDRTINKYENQIQTFTAQIQSKDKTIQEIRGEIVTEKGELNEKLEQLREKYQQALDEISSKKMEFERERALKGQQLEFQDQRVTELQRQLEDTIKRYDERQKQDREDLRKDYQEKAARITQEKEAAEAKYEQKRKALKELESNANKNLSQSEREKAVLVEKYQNLELQQKDLMRNYESEIEKLRTDNDQLQRAISLDKQAVQEEVERWRQQFLDMERQCQDLSNNYDKDKALWDGKYQFLEQQKEQAKKDLEESQRKFSAMLDQLQKAQSENKAKCENQYTSTMAQMEQKYTNRIKELQENLNKVQYEYQTQVKSLERDNKQLQDKLELINKNKLSEHGGLEKKLEKLLDEKDRLKDELEQVKAERSALQAEHQKALNNERETYKQKVKEIEAKGARIEGKQTEMLLNHEKDRAKWEHEKSLLKNQKDDSVEDAKRSQTRVEQLTRENEKLKNDLKNARKNLYQAAANVGGGYQAVVGAKVLQSFQGKLSQIAEGSATQRAPGLPAKENAYNMKALLGQGLGKEQNLQNQSMQGVLASSMIRNLHNTPSSKQSDERSIRTSSPEDQKRGQ